jgi:hypothetical protein
MSTEVERIYSEIAALKETIAKSGTPSDLVAFESLAAKCILLAAASYYEKAVCSIVVEYAQNAGASEVFLEFLNNQALNRKYHTLFEWDRNNVNKFIRLFGNSFFKFLESKLAADNIKEAAKEFMFLGRSRNMLVHDNFAEYALDITAEDIKKKFDVALPLLAFFAESLIEFGKEKSLPDSDNGCQKQP